MDSSGGGDGRENGSRRPGRNRKCDTEGIECFDTTCWPKTLISYLFTHIVNRRTHRFVCPTKVAIYFGAIVTSALIS